MNFLVLLAAIWNHEPTVNILDLPITLSDGVRNASECNDNISDGNGDFISRDILLRGKCQSNGKGGELIKIGGREVLFFNVSGVGDKQDISRTELALTSVNFDFSVDTYFRFDLMIPASVDVADSFYYLAQFWQCSPLSPFAGIRVKRGTKSEIAFITRGDDRQEGRSFASIDLIPDEWVALGLKLNVSPYSDLAELEVWNLSKKELIGKRKGIYGFSKKFICNDGKPAPESFRFKFGIYKGYEVDKKFSAYFDNIKVSNDKNFSFSQ